MNRKIIAINTTTFSYKDTGKVPFNENPANSVSHNKSTVNEVRHLVTLACTFSCAHCYEKGMPRIVTKEFSQEEANRFYGYFQPESVSATGGEPLLFPNLVRRIAIATALYGGEMELVTNAWLLNKSFAEELKSLNPKTYFQISLDGPANFHDTLRNKAGAQSRALTAIRMCAELGMTVKARMTVMENNYPFIPELIKTLDSFGLPNIKLVMREAMQTGGAKANNLSIGDKHIDLEALRQLTSKIGLSLTEKCGNCEDSLTIDPQGGIVPCCYFIGNKRYYIGSFYEPTAVVKHPDFLEYSSKCRAVEVFAKENPGGKRCEKCVTDELVQPSKE